MSEDTRSADSAEKNEPLAGERLAAARRDQDISIRDIAKELHLDEARVQALEQNRFETLGAPVFAKGYLRKYAAIVDVPIDDILADYYSLNRAVGAPPVVGTPRKAARDIDLTRWILPAAILLVLVVLFFWWVQSGSPLPPLEGSDASRETAEFELGPPFSDEVAPPDAMPTATAGEDPPLEDELLGEPEPVTAATDVAGEATEAVPAAAPETEPDPPGPQGPQVTLTIRYGGDCWTEVTDAGGSRLFFDLGRAGRTVSVTGTAPLRVLFGDYANVSLSVDGEPLPIPVSARRGETARFSINAP